jgi:hypothetical protein
MQGGFYYCKADKDGRQVRATEWFFTSLAQHLAIPSPGFAILESDSTGETYFGSLQLSDCALNFEFDNFIHTAHKNEIGAPSDWPGSFLESLYAFDMFANNYDRSLQNFLLQKEGFGRKLCAFDYASGNLQSLVTTRFPVAESATVRIGRFLRSRHGRFPQAASEMIERIAAVPGETIASILSQMPDDWMGAEQREEVSDLWSEKRIGQRLAALRAGLIDGSLL